MNDTLTISASQIEESEEKDDLGHYLRKERSSSAYQRAFTIPDIDEEAIKSTVRRWCPFLEFTKGKLQRRAR